MGDDGRFMADTVLAKHDENYMPPEVAETLAKHAAEKAAEAAKQANTGLGEQ
jgi:cytochrome c-type biogenesis protein CcmE